MPPKFQPHIERQNEGSDAWRKLDAFTAHVAKAKAKTGHTKALDAFKPVRADDPRWQRAMAAGDCWVFVEADSFVFGTTTKAGDKIPIFVDWAIVHTMHSVTGKITGFRVNRHQGYWRYKSSTGVMRKAMGNRVDLLSPEGHPLPARGEGVTTAPGERDALTRDLAAALGVEQHRASELFFQWTGR